MRFIAPPSKLGLLQLLVACLLVALFTYGEAHMGPLLLIKGGHGGGGGAAASILAAGLVIHLLTHLKKAHKGGGFSGGGQGYSMGGGHEYASMGGAMEGYGMAHSFESHDARLMDYGYEPQGYGWAK